MLAKQLETVMEMITDKAGFIMACKGGSKDGGSKSKGGKKGGRKGK